MLEMWRAVRGARCAMPGSCSAARGAGRGFGYRGGCPDINYSLAAARVGGAIIAVLVAAATS